jgi:hypothetical protein
LRDWEQNRKHPDAPALAFLRVIAREPGIVARALQGVLREVFRAGLIRINAPLSHNVLCPGLAHREASNKWHAAPRMT